jgi:Effector-associated domain 1/Trypsin-like peptidase domain
MTKELKQGHNLMEPTPIQISNVRLRLRAISAFSSELAELLDEIDEIGEYSRQLIPDLIGTMKRGVYFPTIPLVSIIARLKSADLLDAALAQDDGKWSLNTFDRCTLLTAGFLQFQDPLLEELFQVFENDAEPRRSAIVEALSISGTLSALETLRVIEYRTTKRIPELLTELRESDRITQAHIMIERGDFVGIREQFLTKVRQAIQLITERCSSADTTLDSQAIRGEQGRHVLKREVVPLDEGHMTGEQQKRLYEALLAAFPDVGSLRRMVAFGLNQNLNAIANIDKLSDTVFDLVTWAITRDKTVALIVAARNSNPDNPALRRVAEELQLAPDSAKLESIVIASVGFTDVEAWREKMSRCELAVCRVELPRFSGTGFLISRDIVITNYHVVKDAIAGTINPTSVVMRFDYKTDMGGTTVQSGSEFRLADNWLIDSSTAAELDYVLLRVKESAGDSPVAGQQDAPVRGWLTPTTHKFTEGEPLFIIQHPEARPLAMSAGGFISQTSFPPRIIHSVSTLGGSSGSPCFASDWSLVALHNAGSSQGNEAIPFSAILDGLKSKNIVF